MILMINCSLKGENGNTQYFLELLANELQEQGAEESKILQIRDTNLKEAIHEAKALVIGAPLYVDGLPAQVVKFLEITYEDEKATFPKIPVYVVSNLGFYESGQIKNLLDIVRNWCVKMEIPYGGGLAIGAGPMVKTLGNTPLKAGPNTDIGKGYTKLALAIKKKKCMKNYFTKTKIPRLIYVKAAHKTFNDALKGVSNE